MQTQKLLSRLFPTTPFRSLLSAAMFGLLATATASAQQDVSVNAAGDFGVGTTSPGFAFHCVRNFDSGTLARFQQTRADKAVLVGFQNDAPGSVFNSCGFDYLLNDAAGSKIASRIVCSYVDTTANAATAAFQFQVMNAGVTSQAMKIQGNRVSIGTNQSTDLLRVLNARCNGATWQNACSRELKQDITQLSIEEAKAALGGLAPVTYAYKAEPTDQRVGFIAEDTPALVSMPDGQSLCAMDIVAVLTRVTQEQEQELTALRERVAAQEARLAKQEAALQAVLARLGNLDGHSVADAGTGLVSVTRGE